MNESKMTREDVKNVAADSLENMGLILDLLFDIRDLLTPKPVTVNFNSDDFPNDLGPCMVEFCTDKSARIRFDREDLGTLFMPFSRMAPGVKESCDDGIQFKEFFVGDWIYERMLKTAKEDRSEVLSEPNDQRSKPPTDDDIPF